MDVPIPKNRRDVPPGLGGQHPQEDFEGRRVGTPEISRLTSHIRNLGAPKRRGRENRIEYAWSFRRGIHIANLHPRHAANAGERRRKDGQFHGAGDVKKAKKNTERRRGYQAYPLRRSLDISPCGSRCGSGGFGAWKSKQIKEKTGENLSIFTGFWS